MMDSGQLDFYQHSTLCTNTCRSTKFDLLINNTRFPPDGLTTPTSSQGENCSPERLNMLTKEAFSPPNICFNRNIFKPIT